MARHITEKKWQEVLWRINSAALTFPVIFERLFPYSEYRDENEIIIRPPVFPEGELLIYTETGLWFDYGRERRGAGTVELVAYVFGLSMTEAAQLVFDRVSAASLEQRGLPDAGGYIPHMGARA